MIDPSFISGSKFNISDSTPIKIMDAEDTMENPSDNSEDSADLSNSQFFPLVSYLSPTLGRLVSPYQLLTRREVPRTGMSPRYSRDTRALFSTSGSARSTAKRKAEMSERSNKKIVLSGSLSLSPELGPLRMDLVQKLDTLKVGLSNDIEQDQNFERMLVTREE